MVEDIAQWLDSLGLGQYAQAFAENGVELQHLPHLTDDDLKKLGLPYAVGPKPASSSEQRTIQGSLSYWSLLSTRMI